MNESTRIIKMASLALVDAMVFQEVLALSDAKVPTLSQVMARHPVQQALIDAWVYILEKNYAPIFDLGIAILRAFPSSPFTEDTLKILIAEAQKITSSRALLRHDLMGRIYHRLLLADVAKYYATYYTSVPAAWLLARLSLKTDNPAWSLDWSDVESILSFRIGDLACGSGTLLSASYRNILDEHIVVSASKGKSPDPNRVHKVLLEEVLWGFDVLLYATHLAITGLSLHNPGSVFEKSNMYALPLTGRGESLLSSFGSAPNNRLPPTLLVNGGFIMIMSKSGSSTLTFSEDSTPLLSAPTFCPVNVLDKVALRSIRKSTLPNRGLQKRLQQILKEKDFSGIGQAGLGAVFVVLSDKYLKPSGRLALVCPRSLISGVAWRKIRQLLGNNYEVEYIITSHQAPDGWNFSENTSLSEILLVARKLGEDKNDGRTVIANLWRKPTNEMESIIVANQLIRLKAISENDVYNVLENLNASHFNLAFGGRKIGEAYTVTSDALLSSLTTWGQLAPFAQSELNRVAFIFINSGQIYLPGKGEVGSINITPLADVQSVMGPDVRQIHGAFSKSSTRTPYAALWDHKSEEIRTILQQPNMWLHPKPQQTKIAINLWNKSGKLMIAERLRLNTHRIAVSYMVSEALSNMWWPTRLNETTTLRGVSVACDEHEKIQTLWLNSTFGILGLLSYRQDTEGAWVKFKKETLKSIPVLNVSKLTRKQVDKLLSLFDKFCKIEMEPLPAQFSNAASDKGVRKEMDSQITQILTGDTLNLKVLYEYLAEEPIISLNPLPRF
jgi:hypothetical protein